MDPVIKHDPVINVSHYKLFNGQIDTIDLIKDRCKYVGSGYLGYCLGNVIKYVMRFSFKNGIEDLKKARRYLDYMIEEMEANNNATK